MVGLLAAHRVTVVKLISGCLVEAQTDDIDITDGHDLVICCIGNSTHSR